MEDAVAEELKLGALLTDDVRRELNVLRELSASLLIFDSKRKQLECHFDSLADLIKRKRNEAMEAIMVKEEEAKVAAERRSEELRLREEKLEKREIWFKHFMRVKIEEERKESERRDAEYGAREREMREVKMDAERMRVELCEKGKEVNEMRIAVDELNVRIQVNARLDDDCRRLSDENLALREEVKTLTEQLEVKAQPPGREEQLSNIQRFLQILTSAGIITICDTIKHPEISGEDLFKLVREHMDDPEVATSKVSSVLLDAKDKAQDLVLEALRISYIAELEDQASKSICRSCRILLLEQLCHICPQATSQAREEARKVALEWIAEVENCADNYLEISKFLQFLFVYDMASEFKDEVLVPMLYNATIHEGAPDLCFTLGFENRIAGYIKALLKNSRWLKALEYVSAFKLERRFSVGKIVHEQMSHIKQTCESMLKEGGQGQAAEILNFQIGSLKEIIKVIKNLKYEGKCNFVNLEQRLVKLEKRKCFKKRSTDYPSHSNDLEPSRKKRCKLSGTAKLTEAVPKHSVNVLPEIGSRDFGSSSPSSDLESLIKKGHKLPGTAKSIEVSPKDNLNARPESGSRDLCCSNPTTIPKPLRKEEYQIPGTDQSIESATKNTSNIHPESGSKDMCSSNPTSDPKPLRNEGCQLPGTVQNIESASKDTLNVHPESGSTSSCSNPSSNPKPSKRKGSKLPGTAKSTKVIPKDASNVNPQSGSRTLRPSNPKTSNKKGTGKSIGAPKEALNAFPDIGSRNALHSQEMQRSPFHYHPMQFNYNVNSPYMFPSPHPSWYEPEELPGPPQYYHPYIPFEELPEVPTWHYWP